MYREYVIIVVLLVVMVIGIMEIDLNDFFNNLVIEVKRVCFSSMIDDVYFFVRVVIEVSDLVVCRFGMVLSGVWEGVMYKFNFNFYFGFFFCFGCLLDKLLLSG